MYGQPQELNLNTKQEQKKNEEKKGRENGESEVRKRGVFKEYTFLNKELSSNL